MAGSAGAIAQLSMGDAERSPNPRAVPCPTMDAPVMVALEIPQLGDERLRNWAKIVTSVDESLSTGWAFEGEFVATGGIQDVPVGAALLVYGERGSRANPLIEARLSSVNADATLSPRSSARGKAWARTLRDDVAELLAEITAAPSRLPWGPDLMRYSDAALHEELQRRDSPGRA